MALNQMYGDEVSGACVVDVGSSCTKAGFAGEESPQHIFSSAVGTWCDEGACKRCAINRREVWFSRHRDGQPVDVEYPVVQGLVADWDCLERVWEHTFTNELKVDPREHPILIVEQSFSPREQRAKMAEILFEKHGTPGVFLGRSALMCCIAASKTTGLVLECGGGICTAVPVQEGLVVSSAIQKSALAGDVLTDELARRLSSDGNCAQATHQSRQISAGKFDPALPSSLSAGYSRHVIRANFQAVKEALCQLSEWTLPQGTQVPGLSARMPDGSEVELQRDRFDVPEMLMSGAVDPHIQSQIAAGCSNHCSDLLGTPELLNRAVNQLDPEQAHKFYENTVICGGSSLFPRMADRLRLHIERTFNLQPGKRIISSPSGPMDGPHRQRYAAWVGGSIVASFPGFNPMWVSKAEFDEHGAALVLKRCA